MNSPNIRKCIGVGGLYDPHAINIIFVAIFTVLRFSQLIVELIEGILKSFNIFSQNHFSHDFIEIQETFQWLSS